MYSNERQQVVFEQGVAVEQLPRIVVSGVNHKQVPVALRERFSIKEETYCDALDYLLKESLVNEAVVVSTCNRVEVVSTISGNGTDDKTRVEGVETLFEKVSGVSRTDFSDHLYHLREADAVSHVFRVAAGLDSLVVGEPQILGQIKSAYRTAHSHGATSAVLNRLFHRAFGVAKEVRTRTQIGHHAVSVCYAARELASQIFGDLSDATVMLIGTGEIGTLALKHFNAAGVKSFFVVSHSLSRAAEVAESVDGVPLSLSNFQEFLPRADIIVGASQLMIGDPFCVREAMVKEALRERPGKPQFYIDLAVPRNFEATLGNVSDAFLYNIDDLEEVVQQNLDTRSIEVKRAEVIVDDAVDKFLSWLQRQAVEPSIKELSERCQLHKKIEVEKTMRRLRRAGFDERQCKLLSSAVEDLSDALIARALHRPFTVLKENAPHNQKVIALFREFFLNESE